MGSHNALSDHCKHAESRACVYRNFGLKTLGSYGDLQFQVA